MTHDSSAHILVVDHNRHNVTLMTQLLERQHYQVSSTIFLEDGIQILEGTSTIDLALVDISGFDDKVWTFCQQLRQREIPFLVISPRQHVAIQHVSMAHGASGLLNKPLMMREFSQSIGELLKGLG